MGATKDGSQPRQMSRLDVRQIPVLRDNYVYLVRDEETGACAAVDPAVAAPVLDALDRLGWRLTHILNTHHHHDHVGGNLELKRATGCVIVGNGADAARIPGIDVRIGDGEIFALGTCAAEVIGVSGHTIGHIAYWFADDDALFCGDTLFALGCGRLFEGTPDQMWRSLSRLRALPAATRVYCAHEYTEANAAFALSIEPANSALAERAEAVRARRRAGKPTVPSTIGEERRTNPFLRADDPDFARAAGLSGRDPIHVFAEIRKRKDQF
jgi:hydroxyacylglutathione hydrolase